jgi:hypothetical protein
MNISELFPYETFPIRLEFGENKNTTICYFQCQEHIDKYLERHKLDKKIVKIDYRDEQSTKSSKKRKRSVEQESEPKSKRSSSTSKSRTPSLDSTRNTSRTTKRKK